MFKNIGIIGYGAFGKLLADRLGKLDKVNVTINSLERENNLPDGVRQISLEKMAGSCDLVILAVPFNAYEELIKKLKSLLNPKTVVMDVCSVKKLPWEMLSSRLENPILLIHTLFGPESEQSAKQVVLCDESSESCLDDFHELAKLLGWEVIIMSAEEHDRQMAVVHGLTFFVAESLIKMGYQQPSIPTGFYKNLQNLIDIQRKHSPELTATIESYNPYAAEARAKFIEAAQLTDKEFQT